VTKRKRVTRPKGDFKKKVFSVIHSQVETKEQIYENAYTVYNSPIDVVTDVNRIVPLIQQGVDANNRIGSQIMVQSFNIKGHIILNQTYTTASASRIAVRMMIVTPKRYQHTTDAIANFSTWLPKLLKIGGSERAFSGNIQDLYAPINSDLVVKHYDKIHYMTMPAITSYTNVGVTSVSYPTNSTKFFNINLKCKNKKLTYDEVSNYPFGYGPVMLMGYAHLDGSAPDLINTQVIVSATSIMKYEDA